MPSRVTQWVVSSAIVACGLILSACRNPGSAWEPSWDSFYTNKAYLNSFTSTCTIAERLDSYCLTVMVIERRGAGYDQLAFPEICIPKMDRGEQIRSVWASTPAPMDKPLPYHDGPLPLEESGTEVRFKIGDDGLVSYSFLIREPGGKRERRWTGSDALPRERN
jgi:hypothetical protein